MKILILIMFLMISTNAWAIKNIQTAGCPDSFMVTRNGDSGNDTDSGDKTPQQILDEYSKPEVDCDPFNHICRIANALEKIGEKL